jgi:uncharacterized membrane protein
MTFSNFNRALAALSFVAIATAAQARGPSFTFTDILIPNATNTYVFGFAPNGGTVGSFFDSNNAEHGFIRNRHGVIQQIDVPGAPGTAVQAVSAAGTLLQTIEFKNASKSYLLTPGGTMMQIAVPGAFATQAWAMNNAGTIVGSYVPTNNPGLTVAFMYQNGTFTTFRQPKATLTAYYGINNSGVIAGTFYPPTTGVATGFILANGKMTTIQHPVETATIVQGINDKGEIIGYLRDSNNISNDGFVYKNRTFTDFGVGPDSFDWGWAIDNAGNIAGFDIQEDENVAGFVGKVK